MPQRMHEPAQNNSVQCVTLMNRTCVSVNVKNIIYIKDTKIIHNVFLLQLKNSLANLFCKAEIFLMHTNSRKVVGFVLQLKYKRKPKLVLPKGNKIDNILAKVIRTHDQTMVVHA